MTQERRKEQGLVGKKKTLHHVRPRIPNSPMTLLPDLMDLPPPRGKHRYSSSQEYVEAAHLFIRSLKFGTLADENVDTEGTTWIERFIAF